MSCLLTDACPDVPDITSDTANRIFDNAIRTVSVASESPRAKLAGARLALSAAFCIGIAAGMLLLLQSMASERADQHQALQQSIAIHNQFVRPELAETGHAPQLSPHQSRFGTSSPIINRILAHRLTYAAFYGTPEREAPPASVCSMATFTIYSPTPAAFIPPNNRSDRNDSDKGSLIVMIVNGDDQGNAGDPAQNSDINFEKTPNTIEDPLSNLFLVSRDSEPKPFLELIRPDNCSAPISIEAGLTSWLQDKPGAGNEAFTSSGADHTLELSLPNYNAL